MIFKGDSSEACSLLLNHSALLTLLETSATACTLIQSNAGVHSGDGRIRVLFKGKLPVEQETFCLTLDTPLKRPGPEGLTVPCWIRQSAQGNALQEVLVLSPKLPLSSISVSNSCAVAAMFLKSDERFSLLKDKDLPIFIEKMCRAEMVIYSVWPEFFILLKQFISTVIPAEVKPEIRNRVVRYGASRKDLPGAIFMNDYHRQEISLAELCENLIHETVHNLLFFMEEAGAWFKYETVEQLVQSEIPSPWSSRRLPIYSFFHAIIVFRVIAQWSDRCQKSNIFSGDDSSNEYIYQRPFQLNEGFSKAKKILLNEPIDEYLNATGKSMLQLALAG